jgi:hypothetical protein
MNTTEEQQDSTQHSALIYGPVQGFSYGEHDTVTMNFQGDKKQTVPFILDPDRWVHFTCWLLKASMTG